MKKIILFLGILFTTIACAYGQNVNFTASGPSAVANQSQFRVTFTVNGNAKDFRTVGEITGFDVLMGPMESRSQSVEFVNGKTNSSISTTYTFTLQAQKEGTFTIPTATVTVDNKKYISNSLTIKVLPADQPASQQQSGGNTSSMQNVGGVEVFVRAIPSKTTIYEQEAVLLTFKLYFKGVNIAGFTDAKFPETKGFMSQDIEASTNKQAVLENYNGKNYNTVVLKESLLFPQQTGTLEIEQGKFDMLLRIPNAQPRGIFDDFFNAYPDVKRSVNSAAVKIDVKPLPTGKPRSYANAVGNFSLRSSINTTELKVNDPITIKVEISGTGNLKLIKNPEIVFPADFEIYDPKIDSKLKTTTAGVSGSKTIEYLAIPRHSGKFTIPSAEFTYFDLRTKSYKTLKTEAYDITVEKGEGTTSETMTTFVNKESLKFLGSDIRYINTRNLKLKPKADFFFGTAAFAMWYILPVLLSIILFIIFRKQAKENANVALVRTKKANKVAIKRLKQAQKYLTEGEKEKFYDEVLKALWGYFSDKLNIPVASLTKDNIEQELSKAKVDEKLIADFNSILSTCEYARYAPGNSFGEMEQLYNQTVEKIGELEEKIKMK